MKIFSFSNILWSIAHTYFEIVTRNISNMWHITLHIVAHRWRVVARKPRDAAIAISERGQRRLQSPGFMLILPLNWDDNVLRYTLMPIYGFACWSGNLTCAIKNILFWQILVKICGRCILAKIGWTLKKHSPMFLIHPNYCDLIYLDTHFYFVSICVLPIYLTFKSLFYIKWSKKIFMWIFMSLSPVTHTCH